MSWFGDCLVVFLLISSVCQAQKCTPGDTCKAPDCRCWDDPAIPGGLSASETPQMVLVSFEYVVNSANVELYESLFKNLQNPNSCQPKGTFFVQKEFTDFTLVKTLSDSGHELGMTSLDGRIPQDEGQWKSAYSEMKAELVGAGVAEANIMGCRGPELYSGGNAQFNVISELGLAYDSTCVSLEYTSKENLKWPYTYDYVDGTPECTIGSSPTQAYPGVWQFLVADLDFKENKCASPSSCSPFISSSQDAFDMFYEAFAEHNDGQRSPFVMYLDPMWLAVDYQLEGTLQFLDFIRSSYDDTWILTHQQALAWMKDPVNSDGAKDFKPWACA